MLFECTHCGRCCKLAVRLTKEDIHRIEMLGYKRKNFVDGFVHPRMKRLNNACFFLEKMQDGIFYCKIYSARPITCKRYPFRLVTRGKNFELVSDPKCPGVGKGAYIDYRIWLASQKTTRMNFKEKGN
ncbi:MAG: YkgJ family cysteine cluster protein [Euryarchaeota archaeon]|nr:YkgJ family cysteine cluster protein [Euryarchaeota archaeon]